MDPSPSRIAGRARRLPVLTPVLLGGALLLAAGCTTIPRAEMFPPPTETIFAPTVDGWSLEIHRFRPDTVDPERLPLVLMHGQAVNGRFFTYDRYHGALACYLQEQGWDVYVPNLRGHAGSVPENQLAREMSPDVDDAAIHTAEDPFEKVARRSIDEYAHLDVPAILDAVTASADSPRVVWVGHSLGGMILYAYLTATLSERVQAFVALASPPIVPHPPDPLVARMTEPNKFYDDMKKRLKSVTRQWAWLAGLITSFNPMDELYWYRQNLPPGMLSDVYAHMIEDIPGPVSDQLALMVEGEDFVSRDGDWDYAASLGNLQIPVLLACGTADRLGTVASLEFAREHLGAPPDQVEMDVVDTPSGGPYGHCDLVLGKGAPEATFPVIARWLDHYGRRDAPAPRVASAPTAGASVEPLPENLALQRALERLGIRAESDTIPPVE